MAEKSRKANAMSNWAGEVAELVRGVVHVRKVLANVSGSLVNGLEAMRECAVPGTMIPNKDNAASPKRTP